MTKPGLRDVGPCRGRQRHLNPLDMEYCYNIYVMSRELKATMILLGGSYLTSHEIK